MYPSLGHGSGTPLQLTLWTLLIAFAMVISLLGSLVVPGLGFWLSIALAGFAILFSPILGLGLALFIAPFQQFPGIETDVMRQIQGITWSLLACRLAICLPRHKLRCSAQAPEVILFGLFAFLVLFDTIYAIDSRYFWSDAIFVGCILGMIVSLRLFEDVESLVVVAMVAIIVSISCSIIYDVSLIYGPLPKLLAEPPDHLRLAGLHANPNATGKFFLALLSILVATVAQNSGLRRKTVGFAWVALGLVGLAIAATGSKSVILAFFAAMVVLLLVSFRPFTFHRDRTLRLATAAIVFAAMVPLWAGVLAPPVKLYAAAAWLEAKLDPRPDLREIMASGSSSRPTEALAENAPVTDGIKTMGDAFRVGRSTILQAPNVAKDRLETPFSSVPPSNYRAVKRDCGIGCTGQRDLLWGAGWQTVREHWLLGIGFRGWKIELEKKLGFPFDSPHSGFLELWGEFGIVGAVMYLSLVVLVLWRIRAVGLLPPASKGSIAALGFSIFSLSILITELFDPAKFFAISPHAIWIWTFVTLQGRLIRSSRAAHSSAP